MTIIKKKKELDKMIKSSKNIFIMGHKYIDLDALGSSIGIYEYVKRFNKEASIIINDKRKESGVKKVLDKIGCNYRIVRSSEIKKEITKNSLIIVVDTNKENLVQDNTLLLNNDKIVDWIIAFLGFILYLCMP